MHVLRKYSTVAACVGDPVSLSVDVTAAVSWVTVAYVPACVCVITWGKQPHDLKLGRTEAQPTATARQLRIEIVELKTQTSL